MAEGMLDIQKTSHLHVKKGGVAGDVKCTSQEELLPARVGNIVVDGAKIRLQRMGNNPCLRPWRAAAH